MIGLPLQPKLITHMHHPINQNRPHKPIEILLPHFYIVGLDYILSLPVLQTDDGLYFGSDVYLWLEKDEFAQLLLVVG